jgi:glucuronoarabinoxylan endo-1,4-beta-xylanase
MKNPLQGGGRGHTRPYFAVSSAVLVVSFFAAMQTVGVQSAPAQSSGTVDFTTHLQPIDGFGFADPFGRSGYVEQSPAVRDAIVDQFFNPVTGAGASILRIGIITDSNIEPESPGSPTAPPTYAWDGVDGGQVWFAQQAQKYGVKRFYADSWSAPGFMKTNNDMDNGGAICGTPNATCPTGDWRQAYASYLVQYATFYKQAGIPITDLSFVNEPNENVSYASMVLTTAQVIDFLKVLGPTMQSSGLGINLNCCDHSNWSGAKTYTAAVVADPVASQYVNTYTGHEYGVLATSPLPTTKNTWMSEWASANATAFNVTWDIPSNAQNDGMHLANDISNALSLGSVSAYVYWYGDSTGATGGFVQMSDTSNATSFVVTKRLFALAGFARFVRPGAFRVPASTDNSNLNITAFINVNGNKVINIVNNATTTVTAALTLDANTANAVPTSYFTDENDTIAPSNLAQVNGQLLTATLAPRSLSTITLAPAVVNGSVQLVSTPTLQKLGDGSYQATFKITNMGTGTAQDVQLNSSSLGSAAGSTLPAAPMPFSLGNIAPNSYINVTVNYPPAAGTSGSVVIGKLAGTYSGGALGVGGTFGGSMRSILP